MAMEVEVNRTTGTIRVRRVACAHDCGQVINPDAVKAQIEGNILQTLSRTLQEEVEFVAVRVTSYPILAFPRWVRVEAYSMAAVWGLGYLWEGQE